MGFFDDYEDDERPRRRSRKVGNLDWQDMVEEIDDTDEGSDGEETLHELEVDDNGIPGRKRGSRDDEFEPDIWDQEEAEE